MDITSLCIKVFFARIIDVSLATFVTILSVKGKKIEATILGFIDVIIWFIVVKEALNTEINSIWITLSYAGGYAIGTYVGTVFSDKLINGKIMVQVVLNRKYNKSIDNIRKEGFALSQVNCIGKDGKKNIMLFIEVDKRKLPHIKKVIKSIDSNAFLVINETKYVENGFFK